MKVCLIQTPWIIHKNSDLALPYPLGIMYVASYLEKHGIGVEIIDTLALGFENRISIDKERVRIGLSPHIIENYIRKTEADFFGVSCLFTTQSESMHETVKIIKESTNKPVFVGGAHPSLTSFDTMKDENIDYLVKGEGELTTLELIQVLGKGGEIDNIKGLYHRHKETKEIIFAGEREPIINLDDLPFPAYHLIPLDLYFSATKNGAAGRDSISTGSRWAGIITSRGCPYKCTFCSSAIFWGHKWRYRSIDNIVAELKFIYKNYNINRISFEDDNMTLIPKRAEELFNKIINEGLSIDWDVPNGIRADRLSKSLIKKMKQAGCIGLTIGVESGDQCFLNNIIGKSLSLSKVEENASIIIQENIPLNCFFIVGIPGENKKIFNNSLNFARKLSRMGAVCIFFIAVPLPGTAMYESAKMNNFLIKENITPFDYLMGMNRPLLKTKDFSPHDVLRWKKQANRITLLEMIFHNPMSILRGNILKSIISKGPLYTIRRIFRRIS